MYFRQSRFVSLLLAILIFSSTWAYSGENAVDRTDPKVAHPTKPATFYKIQAGIEGEIYPVFANYASLFSPDQRSVATVTVTITNPGKENLRQRVAVTVVGWSDEEIQLSDVAPGGQRSLSFAPTFLPRFYDNREIIAATVHVTLQRYLRNQDDGRNHGARTLTVRRRHLLG